MNEDWDLIVASFQSQYGIRLSRDLSGMKWSEFKAFISGFGNDTPLGKIISIRAEDDPETLRRFNDAQRSIRNKWRTRRAKKMPRKDLDQFLAAMQEVFKGMSGGVPDAENAEDQVH